MVCGNMCVYTKYIHIVHEEKRQVEFILQKIKQLIYGDIKVASIEGWD